MSTVVIEMKVNILSFKVVKTKNRVVNACVYNQIPDTWPGYVSQNSPRKQFPTIPQ